MAAHRNGSDRPRSPGRHKSTRRPPARRPLPLPSSTSDVEESPGQLGDYLRVLIRHRGLAFSCFAATVGIAVAFTLLAPRRYTAAARVQVARQSPIQLHLDTVVSGEGADRNANGPPTFLATLVAALQSRDLAERVIGTHRLSDPDIFTRRHAPAALPDAKAPTVRDGTGDGVDPELVDRYLDALRVREVQGTELIDVSFTTPSPALSALLAGAHVQAYIDANQDARRAVDAVATGFLGRQLRESQRNVKAAEVALGRFAAQHPDVAVHQQQKVVGQRDAELSSLLTKAEGTRIQLESRYDFLKGSNAEPADYFLDRPAIQKLRLDLMDVRQQRATLRSQFGPKHPQMLELGLRESEINQQLRGETERAVAGVRAQYQAAKLREDRLQRQLLERESGGTKRSSLGARYDLLKNDVETAHALHASLLKQRADTTVNSALVASNIREIERPTVPRFPSRPKVPLDLTLGVAAGLVIAIGAAFAREHFDHGVKSTEDVEGLLQVPSLVTIPNFALARAAVAGNGSGVLRPLLPAPRGNGRAEEERTERVGWHPDELVVLNEPWSRVAEAFRSMRSALLFSASGPPPKLVLITSTRAAEGKTVACLNLASTLAESEARVLVVDADLRHPRCHLILGVENRRGLSSYLAGEAADLDDLIVSVTPRLSLLPAGPLPMNPAELAGSSRMRALLRRLKKQYDFVVVDTPPALPVTDPIVLSQEADGVLLVVKGHDTPRELVRRVRDRLVQTGARLLGVVVNNVDAGWGDPYFFYAPYYGAGYDMRPANGDGRDVREHDTPRGLVGRVRDRLAQTRASLISIVNNIDINWGHLYFNNVHYHSGSSVRGANNENGDVMDGRSRGERVVLVQTSAEIVPPDVE